MYIYIPLNRGYKLWAYIILKALFGGLITGGLITGGILCPRKGVSK